MPNDFANTPRLLIAGREHRNWLRYSVDSDYFTPADGWTVSLGLPAGILPAYLQPWAECQLYMGSDVIMTGRLDTLRRTLNKGQHTLELSGRDLAAVLLDCSAPIFVQREASLPEVVTLVARPLGIAKVDIQGGDTFEKITVEPGMTAWDALQRAAEANGLWPWFAANGTLKVAAPDYTTPVVAELVLNMNGKNNNVLELAVSEDCTRRYSEITVLGQSNGDEEDEGDSAIKGGAKSSTFPAYRPLIRNEGHIDSVKKAQDKAVKLMADGIFASLEITARVRGHRIGTGGNEGALWEPGQRVHVCSDAFCMDAVYFLTKRVFASGREGTTTTLTLKPDGVWLPDTARKPKGKKKKEEEEDDWGE